MLEAAEFDIQVAGAELLGRDVALICSSPALALARSVLEPEHSLERLIHEMVRTSTVAEALPFVERMANSFRRGLLRDL